MFIYLFVIIIVFLIKILIFVVAFFTKVGGTYYQQANGEIGWGSSGGGFSNLWPRPAWQDSAVKAYLASSGLPPSSLYNASGRAFPDVSTVATNFQVYTAGESVSSESGTSAAAPTFAAYIALINDLRIRAGKSPLGFLNPALYSLSAGVGTDIVKGNNKNPSCPAGFPALKGWDAITGLGTPIYSVLLSLA
jgi:tripeptidyl-peptidase-1